MDSVRRIADAVLYEGYVLWPYRRSALKNQQRWTFGAVHPAAYSAAAGGTERCVVQTQCLLEADVSAVLDVRARFLHIVRREVFRAGAAGRERVDELTVAGTSHLSWEEATEREVRAGGPLAKLHPAADNAVNIAAGQQEEPLREPGGKVAGTIERSWEPLTGQLTVGAEPLAPGLWRITVRLANTTGWPGVDRAGTLPHSFLSAHAVLHCPAGAFVSSTDPPAGVAQLAAGCANDGLWPVLVGEDGDRRTVLASPIILSDYPQVAPESPGDLFDGGEIDELLVLNILTLTEEEQREMAATDPRTREILDRCRGLTPEQLMRLHGTFRDLRPLTWG